ncbi:hypothetical protein AB0E56_06440 [Microbacterium sp. NPDC028030]|uniref:hypothetical protein n=1 Tax=Microbacterium sp. NPDC028030 TaxID=3155124 RepID=UPI0033EDD762
MGTAWASMGATGHSSSVSPVQATNALQPPGATPIRARMWKFSLPLRHPDTGRLFADIDHLSAGLQRRSIDRYMWLIHDRDEGSAPHLQGALRLTNSRTSTQLSSILGLPATALRPLRDRSGQHGAFERYCRYLLHESIEAQEDGKFHYSDSAVHSNFDFRDMIDRYFGFAASGCVPTVESTDQIRLKVYNGDMTPSEVHALHPMIFIRNHKSLEELYHKGRHDREIATTLAERAAREGESASDSSAEIRAA